MSTNTATPCLGTEQLEGPLCMDMGQIIKEYVHYIQLASGEHKYIRPGDLLTVQQKDGTWLQGRYVRHYAPILGGTCERLEPQARIIIENYVDGCIPAEVILPLGHHVQIALELDNESRMVSKKLKGLMAQHGITIRKLSNMVGISEKSLSLKINGRRKWRYWEAIFIVGQFGFSEVKDVFPELYDSVLRAG